MVADFGTSTFTGASSSAGAALVSTAEEAFAISASSPTISPASTIPPLADLRVMVNRELKLLPRSQTVSSAMRLDPSGLPVMIRSALPSGSSLRSP